MTTKEILTDLLAGAIIAATIFFSLLRGKKKKYAEVPHKSEEDDIEETKDAGETNDGNTGENSST